MLTKGTVMKKIWMRIAVAVSAVVAVVGAFVGSGAAGGTPIQDAAGGALSASSTAIAPDGPAFSIWSVVYVGLIAYAIRQLFRTSDDARHATLAVPAILSLLLNAAWILSVQFGFLWASEPIIVALLAVLVWTFTILRRTKPSGIVEAIVTDGTFGLYLGWVCVATAANTAAVLTAAGFRGFDLGQDRTSGACWSPRWPGSSGFCWRCGAGAAWRRCSHWPGVWRGSRSHGSTARWCRRRPPSLRWSPPPRSWW